LRGFEAIHHFKGKFLILCTNYVDHDQTAHILTAQMYWLIFVYTGHMGKFGCNQQAKDLNMAVKCLILAAKAYVYMLKHSIKLVLKRHMTRVFQFLLNQGIKL
jgi:hypothetical protein